MTEPTSGHHLKKELHLRDLVQMQILLVVGVSWLGIAARQGGVHLVFWIAGILTLFLPSAAVVTYCVRIWPEEGGVYEWTRHTFGPLTGFLCGWNFAIWALLLVSGVGLQTASSLSYSLGPAFAWIKESKAVINTLNISIFALILVVCVVGLKVGKWVAHFGTLTLMLVYSLLIALLFHHPGATAAHPHHAPQSPFSLAIGLPVLSLLSLNLFGKMALGGLTGLEQIAVFAGEIKNAASAIWKSAWIAAPFIALIFILGTGSILTYIPADQVDLNAPIPQILAAALGGKAPGTGIDWGLMLGRAAILAIALNIIASFTLVVAATSRLPMVAGWDKILPDWFTALSPRFGTPVRSIVTIVVLAFIVCFLATYGTGAQEAFQLVTVTGTIVYNVYFGMMLLIPLVAGARFGKPPSLWIKLAALSGFLVTLLSTVLSVFPVIDVPHPMLFGVKVIGATLIVNLLGVFIYRQARRPVPVET